MKRVILLLLSVLSQTRSHVSLKFPAARDLDLDFLDNIRTNGDCGMDPGEKRTFLLAGSELNFTWHLGYAHGGGYKLELVDPSQDTALLLLPQGGQEGSFDTTGGKFAQNAVVTLPNVECPQCYLRFQRQATEWGRNYRFRSCADVSLVREMEEEERCSGAGTYSGGRCNCERLREGDRCQYQTLCSTDADCNGPKGQGRCLLVSGEIFPYKECFCADGWYGAQCENQARWGPGQGKNFQRDQFTEVELQEEVSLLWRVTEESEVEMIMTAPTTTWLGLGWRPADTDKSCHNFPSSLGKYSAALHAMDCMDIVVGTARGNLGRVADYYTRDRSTPRLDEVWGGEDDLVSWGAWEEEGQTVMRFVRRMTGGGGGDHDLQGTMRIIWAHGQQDNFYREDQLKYHGRSNRGINSLELPISSSSLFGLEWSPVNIGILVSCILVALLMLIQMCQNCDRKLKFLTPFSYKSFSPEN